MLLRPAAPAAASELFRLVLICTRMSNRVLPALVRRNLRNQPRILIHVNLCSAMFLYGVINVAYTAAVKKPSVSMDGDSSIMGLNTVRASGGDRRLVHAVRELVSV